MPEFDISSVDSQGTVVEPISADEFDFDSYAEYEAGLLESNSKFWNSQSGVLVHRRFRVPSVFAYDCKDMKRSLGLQLAALKASMDFKMDVPNFLEPWYGIGTVASSFGLDYEWYQGQAPAIRHSFSSVDEALKQDIRPISETATGKKTLAMTEYFLEQTKGKMPMSFTDTQSSMNAASHMIESNSFYLSFFDNPEGLKKLLDIITKLMDDFNRKQLELTGSCLVKPGHGFASSRVFRGLGMSDDIMVMLSPDQYRDYCYGPMAESGDILGGPVFHSCGNWSGKADVIKDMPGVLAVDGAFTAETDPDINDSEVIADTFNDTGIVVNARMVGNLDTVCETVKKLWRKDIKLIVVTYCSNKDEQEQCYDRIHEICS